SGATELVVEATPALKAGQDVDIGWDISDAFVTEHDMAGTWKAFNGKWQAFFRRQVVAVSQQQDKQVVTLDVPIRYPVKTRDKASLKVSSGWISEVGIERLSLSNAIEWNDAWAHDQVSILIMSGVKDGWLRQINSYAPDGIKDKGWMPSAHLQSGGIMVADSKRITIEQCSMRNAQHRGSGGNGYLFEIRRSSEILTRDCEAESGRHNFIQNWGFGVSGCVWLRVVSKGGKALLGPNSDIGTLGYSEFHHSLAMSNLIDDSVFDDGWASQNRGSYSSGAGHTATRNVMWRVQGAGIVKSFNYGQGYVIGTSPDLTVKTALNASTKATVGTAPEDFVEGLGQAADLRPKSLYEAQLKRRLEP
ncbi:MAG TPA: hypothetical protein DCQ06_08835, partial [Myxococcales bacterium]|nr:hypothetical protein [Myxococcales bacterium]